MMCVLWSGVVLSTVYTAVFILLLPVYMYVYHHTKPCSIATVLFDVCLFRDGPLDITGRGGGGEFLVHEFF